MSSAADTAVPESFKQARLWRDKGWLARVIKNPDDDGWAVEMLRDGESEPALVGPWTMGRDKKNPKPLDAAAFSTLVKTAAEVIRRHEQQEHAWLHKQVVVRTADGPCRVTLDIVPDEDDPHAWLTALAADGERIGRVRVRTDYRLTAAGAADWIAGGCCSPS
jgi:hypothetical protein